MPNPFARLVDLAAPRALGRDARLLLVAALVTNLGDGLTLAAGPLLVATHTRDPLLVSMAVLSEALPVLLFGVLVGAIADRADRRRIVVGVNAGRAVVMVVFAGTIVTGTVNIAIVLVVLFILGTTETFADVATNSLVPNLVARDQLGVANARIQGAFILANQLAGPPIGAFLFAAGMALPFATDALCFAFGAVLMTRIVTQRAAHPAGDGDRRRAGLGLHAVEGMRWLIGNPPMRTLALTIFAFNVTFGAAWGVLVLYAQERLAMDAVGFGLLTTAMALGGVIGTAAYGRLERRFALGDIMRVGLLIETATHLTLALTTMPSVALGIMVVFGAHAYVWNTTATVVRQRAVPDALLGRVTGLYSVGVEAGIVIGTPIGGLLARMFGITAPFWFGFVGSAVLVTVLWRQFSEIVHAADAGPEGEPPGSGDRAGA